jgi:biotin carboxyl carrier protein
MEGRTLAIATYNSKLDDDFKIATDDPAERTAIEEGMAKTAQRIEADMDPVRAAAVMDTDEVVPVAALRDWLVCLVEAAWQSTGYRRTKNPRIWSVHELETLAGSGVAAEPLAAGRGADGLASPSVGTWEPAVVDGVALVVGATLGWLRTAGIRRPVVAPEGVGGVAAGVLAAGTWVEHGTVLLVERTGVAVAGATAVVGKDDGTGPPPGTTVVRADTDGTVYLRSEPGTPPYAPEGSTVERAATLALVEVMKTFTPVRSPVAGTVVRVLAGDAGAVRAGDPLFWLAPA